MKFYSRYVTLTATALAAALLITTGCERGSGNSTAEQTVRGYIETSFAVRAPGDKAKLLAFLGGDAKARLEAWSDDQFANAFLDSKRKLGELRFREVRNPSAAEALVTYELSYTDGKLARRTQRKIAELLLVKNAWQITKVQNLRETVEYQNELTVP